MAAPTPTSRTPGRSIQQQAPPPPTDEILDDLSENGGFEEDPDAEIWDMDAVDSTSPRYAPLPPGVYSVVVDDTEYYKSAKGNPTIKFVFQVYNHPNEDLNGRKLFYYCTYTEGGVNRLKSTMLALNPQLNLKEFKPSRDVQELLGCCARAKVRMSMYEGKRTNKVTDIIPPVDGEASYMG